MFWGLIMESGKRYTQTVERAFHLSMAVLELDASEDDDSVVSLRLYFDNREFILCHLNREKMFQVQLDLNFQSGDKIAFLTSGRGRVHLSGYLLETDEDEMDDMDEDDEEDESVSEQMRALLENTSGKRKSSPKASKQTKKLKIQEASEEDDSDEDVEDDDDSEMGSDEEETVEMEDDDESSEEEVMMTSPKQKTPETKKNKDKVKMSAEKQQPNRTPGDKQQQQQQQQQKKKTPNEKQQNKVKSPGEKPQTPVSPATPNGLQESAKKKKKKGQEKQDTPKPETPQRRTLEGGVMVEDLKVGNGPVAKPGRQVQVYYIGRLKQNNKQFDSSTEGPGFKFRLARGEVIKGWDIGVSGMRVGGKRKIVCPPALAYGSKGVPPSIPPNSALVFEVELKSVN